LNIAPDRLRSTGENSTLGGGTPPLPGNFVNY
jgi:hypothetical protein